jgi:hypothetical protein
MAKRYVDLLKEVCERKQILAVSFVEKEGKTFVRYPNNQAPLGVDEEFDALVQVIGNDSDSIDV